MDHDLLELCSDLLSSEHTEREQKLAEEQLNIAIELAELGTWSYYVLTDEVNYCDRIKDWCGFNTTHATMESRFITVHEDDRERAQANLIKALQPGAGNFYRDEYRVIHLKDGTERVFRSLGKIHYCENGHPISITGIVQDITLQRMNEQKLEQRVMLRTEELKNANRKLQRSNEELEQYAFVASHDLQEPLRKIRVFSSMLEDLQGVSNDPSARHLIQKIHTCSNRMSNLIHDLLQFSRVDSRHELFALTDLNKVIRNILEDHELIILEKKAQVHILPMPSIEAIPLQMKQLFTNLLGNALKFTEKQRKPEITISSKFLTNEELKTFPQLHQSWTYCQITFTDNGIGFDNKFADKIFTIFQRLHSSTDYEGTGTGLALCKKIALAHQGDIRAEGKEEQGASFSVFLPVSRF